MTSKKKRIIHSPEFKAETLKLAEKVGVAAAARLPYWGRFTDTTYKSDFIENLSYILSRNEKLALHEH